MPIGSPNEVVVVSFAVVFSGMYDTDSDTPQCRSNCQAAPTLTTGAKELSSLAVVTVDSGAWRNWLPSALCRLDVRLTSLYQT